MNYITKDENETNALGLEFAANLMSGDVVLLQGDLGAGKTTFVKGLAAGLGVREDVTSPTFTLMNLYELDKTPSPNSLTSSSPSLTSSSRKRGSSKKAESLDSRLRGNDMVEVGDDMVEVGDDMVEVGDDMVEAGNDSVKSGREIIKTLCHIDTYRLKSANELLAIGAEDYIGEPGVVTVIEWPEKVETLLKNFKTKKVSFEHNNESVRRISFN
jgi:tRNA A37 threonylcarbamoyladenosine biosynthesis protein TsaE